LDENEHYSQWEDHTMTDETRAEGVPNSAHAPRTFLGCGCLAWAVAGILFFGVAVALLLPAKCSSREAARRAQCTNNLKQIALAMHIYHEKYGCLPPAYVADAKGHPLHSWRVLLLPYLEQGGLYDRLKLDEPWDSPHNHSLLQNEYAAQEFHCPSALNPKDKTSYVMIVGPGTISDGPHSVRLEDIKDGTLYTIMIVEVKDSGIHWAEPRDLTFEGMDFRVKDPGGKGINSDHPTVANVLFADGAVRSISNDIDSKLLKSLITINGKEDVSEFFRNQ
jgi:prepilin-type processing-associated H-X9-DG protein